MQVKESGVWGISADRAIQYGRSYQIRKVFILIIDILFMGVGVSVLYSAGTKFGDYFGMMLILSLMCFLALSIGLQDELLSAYKFISKYGKCEVKLEKLGLTAEDLYTVLSKVSKIKLKKDDSVENYLEMFNTICRKDIVYSARLMKALDYVTYRNPDKVNTERVSIFIYFVETKSGKRRLVSAELHESSMYNRVPLGSTLGIADVEVSNEVSEETQKD